MILRLVRKWIEDEATIGELYVDGVFEAFTLEDLVRDEKIPGQTAIPAGTYKVILTTSERVRRGGLWSPRKDCALPLVCDVPGFEGIRIHAGNGAKDTSGCVLVGKVRGEVPGQIFGSRAALTALVDKIAGSRFQCQLQIEDMTETV